MKLKGKATITLINRDGSIAYQEKHTNAITPALAKILGNNLSGTVDYTKLTPIIQKLLGGVCLWHGSLDETSVYLPKQSTATLTAHAGTRSTGGTAGDNTRGTPNTSEGSGYGPIPNGFRFVWEWGSGKGDGKISGLTLCHQDVGDYYNQLHAAQMTDFAPIEDVSNYVMNDNDMTYSDTSPQSTDLPTIVGYSGLKGVPVGFYGDMNHVVSIENVEDETSTMEGGGDGRRGHVNIYISQFSGKDLWLENGLGEVIPDETRTISVSIRWQLGSTDALGRCLYYVAYDEEIKHLYLLQTYHLQYNDWDAPSPPFVFTGWPYNYELQIIDVDLEDGTHETKTVDLPFMSHRDLPVFRMPAQQYNPKQLHVFSGSVIIPVYKTTWVSTPTPEDPYAGYYDWRNGTTSSTALSARVNLRTGVIEDYLSGGSFYEQNNASNFSGHIDLGNDRSVFPTIYVEKRATASTTPVYDCGDYPLLYDASTITRDTQIFGSDQQNNRTFVASSDNELIQFATSYRNGDGDKLKGAILNKMYQASVFRLAQTVTKTSEQTMKVEYEIYQEEES